MHIIDITVRDKIATHVGDAYYVCGNSDFVVRFDFDEEWAALDVKTARFIREDGAYHDQVFSGSECPVPIISNTNNVRVGVFAGNLQTTTPARIPAAKSILCPGGMPAAPQDDVYNQIMEEVNETRGTANGTAQALQEACGSTGLYLVRVELNEVDRSYEEIVAAINAGKTCLLVDGFSRVFTFSEISSIGTIIFRMVLYGVPLSSGAYTAITVRELHIEKDGTTRQIAISPAKAPNPCKLTIKQGDKSTEYDGREEVSFNLDDVADVGEGGLYLVTCDQWGASNRTQEEVRAAVAAGKTCLFVEPTSPHKGDVFTYAGEGVRDGETCPVFVRYGHEAGGIIMYRAYIMADGLAHRVWGSPITTPNPRKLTIKQGGTTTEYDGSKAVEIKIPDAADDTEGEETVILEEGTYQAEDNLVPITNKLSAIPVSGMVYQVTYNGVTYDCPVLVAYDGGAWVYMFGDFSLFESPEAGNPDAPFCILMSTNAEIFDNVDAYGAIITKDGANPVTLSITGKGERVLESPCFDVRVPVTNIGVGGAADFGQTDKTWAQVEAAYNAGKIIRVIGCVADNGITAELIGQVHIAYRSNGKMMLAFSMHGNMFLHENAVIKRMMYGGDDGSIVIEIPN